MAAPQIGELTDRLNIRTWHDVPGLVVEIDQIFGEGYPVWAKVEATGSAIYLGSMQIDSSITHKIWLRYSAEVNQKTVTAAHVIEDDVSRYRIKRANQYEGKKEWLLVEVELLGDIAVLGGSG